MVSQRTRPKTRRSSSDARILEAAAEEFAARGFDGARVDRIAARAGLNKAMLYYHFRGKAALHRAIITDLFRSLADVLTADQRLPGTPEERVRRFIRTIASETVARPHFPSIWLREMAEGGRHLDRGVFEDLSRIIGVLAGILAEGRAAGVFGPAHPLITQMGIVAPLLLFSASAPARVRLGRNQPIDISNIPREAVVEYVERATLAALTATRSETFRLKPVRATSRRRP